MLKSASWWSQRSTFKVLLGIWVRKHGSNPVKRLVWSLILGFVLIVFGVVASTIGLSQSRGAWCGVGVSSLLAGVLTILISRFACEFLNWLNLLRSHLGLEEYPEQIGKYEEQPLRVRAANRLKEQAAAVKRHEGPGLDPFSYPHLMERDRFEERYGIFLQYGLIEDIGYERYFQNAPTVSGESSPA